MSKLILISFLSLLVACSDENATNNSADNNGGAQNNGSTNPNNGSQQNNGTSAGNNGTTNNNGTTIPEVQPTYAQPESVLWDDSRQVYYISNNLLLPTARVGSHVWTPRGNSWMTNG